MELCARMNYSWPQMALSQIYVPPGYGITHIHTHTVLQSWPKGKHTKYKAQERAHTHAHTHKQLYTQWNQTSAESCPADKEKIFLDLFSKFYRVIVSSGMTVLLYSLHCTFMAVGLPNFLIKDEKEVQESTGSSASKLRWNDTRVNFQMIFPVWELESVLTTVLQL